MKKNLFILSLVLTLGCSPTEQDQYAACTAFDKVDAEMLELIDQIKAQHSGNKKFVQAIDMEQVYWIQYRDRRIRAMYPKSWDLYYRKEFGREAFNSCKCEETLRLANNRMDDLRMYLKGSPKAQQDCPSMMNE